MDRQQVATIQVECQQFLNTVTALMDKAQWEELAACYAEDAVLYRPSDPHKGIRGREAILAAFRDRPPRTTCHLLANSVFEVENADRVKAVSRIWLMAGEAADQVPVKADSRLLAGSFTDRLVRIGDRWHIRERRGGIDLQYDYL